MKSLNYKNEIKRILLIVLLSTLFLLIFSDDTSPLAKYWYGSDSSLFMLFGKALNHGLLPYKDLFDHKGPYYFFLQQIGQFIWEGKNGIFILQIINLSIVLFFSYKIFNLVTNPINFRFKNLFLFPILFVLAGTLEGGDCCEEFALPFLIVSLYFFIKYLKDCDNGKYSHNPIIAGMYGIFFGFIAFSRINNSGYLCAIILTIFIILICHKEVKNIFLNIIYFIIGFLIAAVPIMYFYYKNGILEDMLYSCFVFAFQYSSKISLLERIKSYIFSVNFSYVIPMFIPIILLIISKQTKTRHFMFAIISTIATFVATFIGYNFSHYYILTIPNIAYSIYIYLYSKQYIEIKYYLKNKIVIAIVLLVILGQGYRAAMDFASSMVHIIDVNITYNRWGYYKYYTEQSVDIVNHIPDDEKDSIWGHGIQSRFYMRTDIYPCIKYYDFVDMYFKENLGDVKKEIMTLLNSKKPKWIITPKKEAVIPKEISQLIDSSYILFYENEEFNLFNFSK
jgi:hypothetical protein